MIGKAKNRIRAFAFAAGVVAAACITTATPRAEACGGCFVPPGPSTQVTAHRMAFAISPERTILWDQIRYTGSPSEFGWVLPIRGAVDVGVSSDQLFQRLDQETQVQIVGPPAPLCPSSNRNFVSVSAEDNAGAASGGGGVQVWDQKVVGPYEATQLAATDPEALKNWLDAHGYVLPDAVAPVVQKYIDEGFGFLVIKLVPDADVTQMVPIRVAYEGASPVLPLRMIAAGTGAKVGIQLFVLGDGRWETKNFPNAEIPTESLTWDYAAMSSDWNQKLSEAIASNGGRTWVTESSDEIARDRLFQGLPPGTTTTDAGTVFATDTDQTDIERAFPGKAAVTVTRLFAELPQSALGEDLELQASLGGKIARVREVTATKNHPCPGTGSSSVFGCNASGSSSLAWPLAAVAAVALVGASRRRRA